jgi:hypothetical protein
MLRALVGRKHEKQRMERQRLPSPANFSEPPSTLAFVSARPL